MEVHTTKIDFEIVRKCFPYFDIDLCKEISDSGQWISLEADDSFIKEDGFIKSFPLVLEGSLRVNRPDVDGREALLYYLSAGQVCSMALTCCMGNIKSNINAIAETDSEIVRIPIDNLEKWMVKFPSWKNFVMYSYRHRFDELLEVIDNLAFRKMDERLIKFFQELYKKTGSAIYQGKHQDIANALTSSREVISRLLKQLEKSGLVVLTRNKVDYSGLVLK